MEEYNSEGIEAKWQKIWEEGKFYRAEDFSKKQKKYILVEFPYPSGEGLHVGHCRSYSALDTLARKKRMEGYNVLFPIGWDAFGLPAENYALRTGIHPKKATAKNIANFKKQLKSLGLSFDWSREIDTTDPGYYKWTQWIFLKLFERGLAYQAEMPINWCPSCKIGLANEEVVGGKCERCGAEAETKKLKQWMLKITDYADRLANDLDKVDYPERVKTQQRNWIGRSKGVEVEFKIQKQPYGESVASLRPAKFKIRVFTTRLDTIFGVTALVLAPEHPFVASLLKIKNQKSKIKNYDEIKKYVENSEKKSEFERTELVKEKTGVELKGIRAINPVNNEKIPVWVGDYVVATYAGGAVMVVPAHDKRDFDFAKRYGLEIKSVVIPNLGAQEMDKGIKKQLVVAAETYKILSRQKIKCWFIGTLGVAGYYGRIFVRPSDVDCGVLEKDFDRACEILEKFGYKKIEFKNHFEFKVCSYERDGVILEIGSFDRDLGDSEAEAGGFRFRVADAGWLAGCYRKKMRPGRNDLERAVFLELISGSEREAFVDYGVLVNSGEFNGLTSEEAIEKITQYLEKKGLAKRAVHYKLRDWVFSRQHYWGEPIPLVFCTKCRKRAEKLINLKTYKLKNFNKGELLNPGWVAVPEKDLPVELPYVEKYQPTGTGESPLAKIEQWVNVKCPKCGNLAKRETDTMPNWAGSSWYYLAYTMLGNQKSKIKNQNDKSKFKKKKIIWNKKRIKYWMPVDWYNGGMEHTTLHLLYSRFWHKFLFDIGAVPHKEPYAKRTSHGMVLAEDGRKMSKSFGNVINPDDIVKKFGADTLRLYEMFMGPFDQAIAWNTQGVGGMRRFLEKVWRLFLKSKFQNPNVKSNPKSKCQNLKLERLVHRTIKKVSEDIESFKFNTAISALMILVNELERQKTISIIHYSLFLILLSPFAPHISEEIWFNLGHKESIFQEKWPKYDPKLVKEEKITLIIQINGKVRDKVEVAFALSEEEAKKLTLEREKVKKWIEGKAIKKIVFVEGRLVNIVI